MKRVLVRNSRKIGRWFAFRHLMSTVRQSDRPMESTAQAESLELAPFDVGYYLQNNPDVAASGIDPYQHYVSHGRQEGRAGGPMLGRSPSGEPVDNGLGVHPGISVAGALSSPASSTYSVVAIREPFDVRFYLENNPDVAASGMDPYDHYVSYGKQEGRIAVRPQLKYSGSFCDLDSAKETVLVVSHEGSRTGAPILSLNLVRELKKKYNVVSMLLRGGAIIDDFRKSSDVLVEPVAGLNSSAAAASIVEQVLQLHSISFAIVNSIESRKVLLGLAWQFVPTITLIHEFAAYTRPRDAFREVALWSSDTVFSSPVIREDAVSEYPDIGGSVFHILPQGRCSPGTSPDLDEDHPAWNGGIARALRPEGSAHEMVVVLGAGAVQLRKGVDLFLACAAQVLRAAPDVPVRFVWIGGGYDPERDMEYSVYLADQVRRAGLDGHVKFAGETANIEAAYAASDIMLITSRLDPLPNVAIDAMEHGMPLVCFDRTTGIADVLKVNGLGDECVASYLDVAHMASKTLDFIRSKDLRSRVGKKLRDVASDQFDMAQYLGQLEMLAVQAKERSEQERADIEEISKSPLPCQAFMLPPHLVGLSRPHAIRRYVRSWASGMCERKPFPGFHPGVYLERAGPFVGDPLAHYLRAGQPSGPWCYEIIEPNSSGSDPSLVDSSRIALHLHIYYPDLLPEILQRLNLNEVRPDLLISVPSTKVENETWDLLSEYEGQVVNLKVVPNLGRDVGPLLTAFGAELLGNYDIVGHLHTKKTKDIADVSMAEVWRRFMLENLLGGTAAMADTILARMCADSSIGMVCPDDPFAVRWGQNRPYAEKLASRLPLEALPEHFMFPVGTMFWARVEALRPCFELGLGWADYPSEPLPYDGSVLHALERLLGICASRGGYRLAATHVPGFAR